MHVEAFITPKCTDNSIQYLYLNHNNITEVHNIHFIELTNLTSIYLNNNNIKLVNRLLFSKNIKLTYIKLSYNHITHFLLDINLLPSLKYLNLGYNYITRLNQSIFKNYVKQDNENGAELIISNNSFSCVCNMMWLSYLEEVYIINIKHLNTDVCITCLLNSTCTGVGVFNKEKCDVG